MFSRFRRKPPFSLHGRSVYLIRTDARELINAANLSQRSAAARTGARSDAWRAVEQRAVTNAEHQLAHSISSALSGSIDAKEIVAQVIEPLLSEATELSSFARVCIRRAVDRAAMA